jgi:hypothetical protein
MGAGRFVLPALCIASFAFEAPARAFARSTGAAARGTLGVIGALSLAFYGYWSWVDTGRMRHKSLETAHFEPFKDDLARKMVGEGIRSIGTLDIGRFSYAAPELRIVDLGGLTDRDIARSPGGFDSKEPSPELLERKAPDAFIFTTATPAEVRAPGEFPTARFHYAVERYVSELPWFRRRYVLAKMLPVESGLYFLWFQQVRSPSR